MRPPNGGLRSCWAQPKLPRHPFAAVPVAAALVFTEGEFLVRTPMPIIFMNDDTRFVGEVIRFMGVPAGIALAYDGCGCAESGGHDHHCADCGCGKHFSKHTCLHRPFARRANTFAGPSVPRRNENRREVWARRRTTQASSGNSRQPSGPASGSHGRKVLPHRFKTGADLVG